ncbi:MAG: MBL fold metallo-hydrolase, partial [Persicimonas sp.]
LHLSRAEAEALEVDRIAEHAPETEIERAEWIGPAEALRRWRRGRALLTAPILAILEILAETPIDVLEGSLDRRREARPDDAPMQLCGGLSILPLETQTLPPATRTSAYLVGDERFVVVDPGAEDESQRALLADAVGRRIDAGARLEAIVLTHHHRDHVAGVEALRTAYPTPVFAHAETADRLETIPVARQLDDEDEIALGDHRLECLHTPGHAPGHLCLYHRNTDALLAGDLVTSKGTIVVDPPEGHMGDYLASLERIRKLAPRTIFPAHGWAITEPIELLDHYLEHRREREDSVLDALREADRWVTPRDLIPAVYDDVPRHLWPFAARSLLAHLIHLVERDLAERRDDRFRAG